MSKKSSMLNFSIRESGQRHKRNVEVSGRVRLHGKSQTV